MMFMYILVFVAIGLFLKKKCNKITTKLFENFLKIFYNSNFDMDYESMLYI
jgi:hypothetical protein